jgi:hypothetical protein
MFKYKRGYEHLYEKYKGHYRHQLPLLKNKLSKETMERRKNKNWWYLRKPPEDNEDDWYFWCQLHNVKLQTDLVFCHNCNKILNPNRYNQSNLLMSTPRSKNMRYIELHVCRKCQVLEDKLCKELEEITKLTKKYRDKSKGKM